MDIIEIFSKLKQNFMALDGIDRFILSDEKIKISPLSTEAILGSAERKDFPILAGKEIIQQAEFMSGKGQSFTSQPVNTNITLKEMLELPLDSVRNQGIFIAGINAVMNAMHLIENTVHCKDEGPECCARKTAKRLFDEYGDVKIALIGYQPCLFAHLSGSFTNLRITDLDNSKIGTVKYGRLVEHGINDREKVCNWADIILCTGSTLTNETFSDFFSYAEEGRNIMFYGTTIAGAATLLGLKRSCYAGTNGR